MNNNLYFFFFFSLQVRLEKIYIMLFSDVSTINKQRITSQSNSLLKWLWFGS